MKKVMSDRQKIDWSFKTPLRLIYDKKEKILDAKGRVILQEFWETKNVLAVINAHNGLVAELDASEKCVAKLIKLCDISNKQGDKLLALVERLESALNAALKAKERREG